jgi:hypothetical protein
LGLPGILAVIAPWFSESPFRIVRYDENHDNSGQQDQTSMRFGRVVRPIPAATGPSRRWENEQRLDPDQR